MWRGVSTDAQLLIMYRKQGRREQVLKDAIVYLFPTVYDMPILSNIGVSYTVGKLLISTFQPKYGNLCTSNVLSPGVLGKFNP